MRSAFPVMIVAMFAMSGCIQEPLPSIWDIAVYVQGVDVKDLDEVHFVIERVELSFAGSNGQFQNNERVLSQDVDLDLAVHRATGKLAVFGGETGVPEGEYSGIAIQFERAYGIQDGKEVPIKLANDRLEWSESFSVVEDQETRILFDVKGKVLENSRGYFMMDRVHRVLFTHVDDATSGAEVHEIGQVVELEEA